MTYQGQKRVLCGPVVASWTGDPFDLVRSLKNAGIRDGDMLLIIATTLVKNCFKFLSFVPHAPADLFSPTADT